MTPAANSLTLPSAGSLLSVSTALSGAADGTTLDGGEALLLLGRAAVAAVAAVVLAVVLHVIFRRAGRRSVVVTDTARRGRMPVRAFLVVLAVQQVAVRSEATNGWLEVVQTVLTLGLVAAIAWLVAVALFVCEDVVLARYRVDTTDNRHARRVQTQVTIVRRVLVGVVVILAVAAMLFTFPSVKQIGATIFASAGVLSVVAGLAAQTSLANIFAGLQLAFTDAIRVDDVVVVEEEWGRIEELTLTYVVVHVWDDRRLVLPSTYFTSTPFENWTRRDAQLLGEVTLHVDWTTDFDAMREEVRRVVGADELWDGRVCVLQVTDAVDSFVTVRILVSAQDGPTAFDLRCHVREAMVRWLVDVDPGGLPRLRVGSDVPAAATQGPVAQPPLAPAEQAGGGSSAHRTPRRSPRQPRQPAAAEGPATPATTVLAPVAARDDSLFTGSFEALARSRRFAGPSEAERAGRGSDPARGDQARDDEGLVVDRASRRPLLDQDTSTRVLPVVPERASGAQPDEGDGGGAAAGTDEAPTTGGGGTQAPGADSAGSLPR